MKKKPSKRSESLFEQMAVKGAKPDACGYVPFDPKILKAMGFNVE
jgi:hypothetical protein